MNRVFIVSYLGWHEWRCSVIEIRKDCLSWMILNHAMQQNGVY